MTNFFVRRKGDCSGKKLEVLSVIDGYFVFRGGVVIPMVECEICASSEQWEDVTAKVDYCGNLAFAHRGCGRFGDEIVTDDKGYRFTKIDGLHHGPAFIVERKLS